jgi:hypothetical protein
MKQPRVMRSPNGGVLNIEVSSLQLGLTDCRAIAENGLSPQASESDMRAALQRIVAKVRATLHCIETEKEMDEVSDVLST